MSIMPLPDLTPRAPETLSGNTIHPSESIHLSALDAYVGQPGALLGVTFWLRVVARLLDTVVHYCIAVCAGVLIGFLVAVAAGLQHAAGFANRFTRPGGGIALFVFSIFGAIVLELICEGFHGSTPGKLLLSFVVVQEDGTPCRPGSAVIRSLAYFVDALFFGLIGYFAMQKTPQRQRHGDEWAHTIVCNRADVVPQNLRGAATLPWCFYSAPWLTRH